MTRKESVFLLLLLTLTVFSGWAWVSTLNRLFGDERTIAINSHLIDENMIRIRQIERINEKIKDNINRIDRIDNDRWTGADQRAWRDELQRLNPDLKLPKGEK